MATLHPEQLPNDPLADAGLLGQMHGLTRQLPFVAGGSVLSELCSGVPGDYAIHCAGAPASFSRAARSCWSFTDESC